MTETLDTLMARFLADPGAGWSMGSFGAIAEFHQDPEEPAITGVLSRVTTRGGIRLENLAAAVPVAYETLMKRPDRWGQGVALCLPGDAAARARRGVLSELGPDEAALRPEDQGAVLFDMGLEQPQVDFCIRTADPGLLRLLRAAEGRSLFAPDNPAMAAILAAHPHRVALTALGRVEVYQKIGGPDTGGVSPPGPHTHVLPQLLRARRTHSANIALPEGLVPCAGLYPESALAGPLGEEKPFDPQAFAGFQALLDHWGLDEHRTVKSAVDAALRAGKGPEGFPADSRIARRALRIALRQALRLHGETPLLTHWLATVDRAEEEETDTTPESIGH